MIATEVLNQLWLRFSSEPTLPAQLRKDCQVLIENADYQRWHASEPRAPFPVQSVLREEKLPALENLGLIVNGELQVKINQIGDRYFVTDGAWVSHLMRVFPDPDEADILIKHADEHGHTQWADWVIDPAAGCGHTPIGFRGNAKRISCDANARALTYALINSRINGLGSNQFLGLLNDMNLGLPSVLKLEGNILFLSNVPFAPAPDRTSLAINSAGGATGADLQLASFHMVKKIKAEFRASVRACFLTWTVGTHDPEKPEQDRWEVPDLCHEVFPESKVEWSLVEQDYDAPELPNPAPLKHMLMHLARSQYAVNPGKGDIRKAYEKLAAELTDRGFTHIAYGMLDCEI